MPWLLFRREDFSNPLSFCWSSPPPCRLISCFLCVLVYPAFSACGRIRWRGSSQSGSTDGSEGLLQALRGHEEVGEAWFHGGKH